MTDTHPTAPHNATDDPANGPTGDPATLLVSLAEATAAFDDAIVDDESRLAAADRLRDAAAAVLATTTVRVRTVYAGRVAGVDADNDVVVPLGEPDKPIYMDDGFTEFLVVLTPCCQADGKGSANSSTSICCRACYDEVHYKYGMPATVAVPVADSAADTVADDRA